MNLNYLKNKANWIVLSVSRAGSIASKSGFCSLPHTPELTAWICEVILSNSQVSLQHSKHSQPGTYWNPLFYILSFAYPLFVSNCDFSFRLDLCFLAPSYCWVNSLISPSTEGSRLHIFPTFKCYSEEDYKVRELMCWGSRLQAHNKKTYLLPSTGRKLSLFFSIMSSTLPQTKHIYHEEWTTIYFSFFFPSTNTEHTQLMRTDSNLSQKYMSYCFLMGV